MAKVQGHLLKYRDDIDALIENADEILQDQVGADEMTVSEWLHRLNLDKYIPKFEKERLLYVSDLAYMAEDKYDFKDLNITKKHVQRRIHNMIKNDKLAVKDFEYQTK